MASPRELLSLLVQQDHDHVVILLDPAGAVVAWLAGAETVFGYTAEEMVGHPLTRLFTPEDLARGVSEHELEVARQDGRAEDDRWQVRKDGTRIWASGCVIPLRDAERQVVGFGKVLRDRTDVKGQIDALENRVEALQKADARTKLFLSTFAHELRNPLAPLANALQLIEMSRPADSDLAYPTQLIRRQVELLRRLVEDLLDVTRIETGKVQVHKRRIDLKEVLTRVAEACRPQADQRRQSLRVILPAGPIVVDADPHRLQQVFLNLATNAIKYTPEGGQIWLKATTEGDEAVGRVQDTGVGIAPETLPRIFDLFTQEAASESLSSGGLGIGLTVVRDLVQLHGGSVQARSEGRGKGSEFTVRLPLAAADGPA